MLDLIGIEKRFASGDGEERCLFSDLSLSVCRGELVSVVGANGSGKSTLFGIVGGSVPVDGGHILLGGADITARPEHLRARRIGRVMQDPSLGTVPHLSIAENIALAENKGKPFSLSPLRVKRRLPAYRALLAPFGLGLEERLSLPVARLSGGQRQCLALLLATLTPIDLLLLDEHTAALDPSTARTVLSFTERIARKKGIAALMVTHDLPAALAFGDRLLLLSDGKISLDRRGEEKRRTTPAELLSLISE